MATREPVFQTTADLTKVLNLGTSPPTIELGISSTLEARIAALEANINPFYCAGILQASGAIRSSKGRHGFTVSVAANGADYTITFNQSYCPSITSHWVVRVNGTTLWATG